ncbi:MAG: 2-hydroxyacyl-CoA dehydratase family protein [Pirellulales bacterium]|nr:2-hydroxyacyl-CoA dehydratase family protein [Pirellulales bacterium]
MPPVSIQPFREAIKSKKQKYELHAAHGNKILGYFCTYTPVELIHAAGFLPMRLMGESTVIAKADTLTPNFICPFLRRTLEDALNGEYDFLSGVVQGYTCDAACGLINIWEENIGGEVFHTLPLPYNDNPDARRFFRSVVLEFTEKLNRAGGRFSEGSLSESLALYGEIRRMVLDLYRLRYDGRLPLNAKDVFTVVNAGFVMPPETYRDELVKLMSAINTTDTAATGRGIPVLVSGSLVEDARVLDILEESGGKVVADDLCSGLRHFQPADGKGDGPLDRLADRYIRRAPCPARARAVDRAPYLADLIRKSDARGVVFLLQKFCTPHLADLPILNETLKIEGIPSIVLEMEETGIMEGQLRTRLESFFEMIGD